MSDRSIHDAAARGFERGAGEYDKGRPGYPPEVVETLNKAVNQALAKPDVIERFAKLGLRPLAGDAKTVQDFVRTDAAEKKRIIDRIGLKRE